MKEKANRITYEWSQRACRHIIHPSDRREVQHELDDHLQDRISELTGSGMRYADALQRVEAAMGDPDEVGRLLAQIHTPWLSWLVTAAKVFCAVCVAISCVLFLEPSRPITMLVWKITHPEYFVTGGEVEALREEEYRQAETDALAAGGRVTEAVGGEDILQGDFHLWFKRGYYAESLDGTTLVFELAFQNLPGRDADAMLLGSRVTTPDGLPLDYELNRRETDRFLITVKLEKPMPVRWKLNFGRLDWMIDVEEVTP